MEQTIEERCKKFATRNYINSDGEVVATMVDPEVYENALVVANTIKAEMIEKACDAFAEIIDSVLYSQNLKQSTIESFRRIMEE